MKPFTPLLMPVALWSLISQFLILQSSLAFKIESRFIPGSSDLALTRRAGTSSGNGTIPLNDKQNTQYLANITVGGSDFVVIVDTGSSDLWIAGNVNTTHDINVTASLQYAVGPPMVGRVLIDIVARDLMGDLLGNINTASVQFAGQNVSNQAYLLVNNTADFASLPSQGISGLLGLGPGQGSVILETVGNSSADPILDRIFQQDTSVPNFISFLLQREEGSTQSYPGQFTVGDIITGYENITSQTQLPVSSLKNDTRVDQHWTIELDKDGVIGPDGKVIKQSSIVPGNEGRLYAVIDSGFTLPQVPRKMSDAIYGRVKGANWSTTDNVWTIPCGQELNISFSIGGVKFPVHPLDASMSEFQLKDANGNPVCVGAFQPITSAFSIAGQFDIILGMAFLRNAYTLLDFGDFVDGSNSSVKAPYVQLLSTTNPAQAHQEFVTQRLGGVDTSGSSQYALLSPGDGQSSPIPLDERIKHTEQKIIRYLPAVVIFSLLGGILLLGFIIFKCVKRRRARRDMETQYDISRPLENRKSYARMNGGYPYVLPSSGSGGMAAAGSNYSLSEIKLGSQTAGSYTDDPYGDHRWRR